MKGVRDTELGDFQRAARTLLAHGLVTPTVPGRRAWLNLRRYASPLDEALTEMAGYHVEASQSSIRLVRRLDRWIERVVFQTPSGRPFDRLRYALVCLTLAALERSGEQITLSDLARRIRQSAEQACRLPFDPDRYPSRQALSHAVRELERLGALRLTDGSREAWAQGDGDGEALYDIDRLLCRQLFALPRGLQSGQGASNLLHQDRVDVGRDASRHSRRQGLIRRLLEQPVVYAADLEDAEEAYLRREAGSIEDQLRDLTGADLERRKEGWALIDPGRSFSDHAFPAGGAAKQAALLLAERLCRDVGRRQRIEAPHLLERSAELAVALDRAAPGDVATLPSDRRLLPRAERPFVADSELRDEAEALCRDLGPALKADHRKEPAVFLRDALEVLASYDLVRTLTGGVALMPALARFREVEIAAAPDLEAQLGLFGGMP